MVLTRKTHIDSLGYLAEHRTKLPRGETVKNQIKEILRSPHTHPIREEESSFCCC